MRDETRNAINELEAMKKQFHKHSAIEALDEGIKALNLIDAYYNDLISIEEDLYRSGRLDLALIAHRMLGMIFNSCYEFEIEKLPPRDADIKTKEDAWMGEGWCDNG